jgi:hypothetical protein
MKTVKDVEWSKELTPDKEIQEVPMPLSHARVL